MQKKWKINVKQSFIGQNELKYNIQPYGAICKPGALQRVRIVGVGVSGVGLRVTEVGFGGCKLQDRDDVALPRQSRTEAANEEAIERENRREGKSNLSNMLPRFGIFGEVLQNETPKAYSISDRTLRIFWRFLMIC